MLDEKKVDLVESREKRRAFVSAHRNHETALCYTLASPLGKSSGTILFFKVKYSLIVYLKEIHFTVQENLNYTHVHHLHRCKYMPNIYGFIGNLEMSTK